jgi:two-component system, LuxR family, response regulator FixJ
MHEIIYIIDDDEGVRLGLCALLEAHGYTATPYASCEEFLSDYEINSALCIVADLRLPNMGGLELQTYLIEQEVELPFIVITGHGDVSSAVRALKSGAVDFIEKPIDGKLFLTAIERAAQSRRSAIHNSAAANANFEKISALTPRERDVLIHIVGGHPNKIIAHMLGISARTVENHRARLMLKMNAESIADLVRMAIAGNLQINKLD